MSKALSQKLIALFFVLLIAVSFIAPSFEAKAASKSTAAAKANQKTKSNSVGSQVVNQVLEILSSFGGEAFTETVGSMTMAMEVVALLGHDDTIFSLNFGIRNVFISLQEASRTIASKNPSGDTMQSSDFHELLDLFQKNLIISCKSEPRFTRELIPHMESIVPILIQGLTEMYGNVVDATGFGLPFGLLSQGSMFLSYFERPVYVTQDTFSQVTNFPEEIRAQFETVINDVVSSYIDPAQLNMALGVLSMLAKNYESKHYSNPREHDGDL